MGHRANYVIVEGSGYQLRYSHWSANTVPQDLFWGPAQALRFIAAQRPCEPDEWLDEVWCEGAASLDLDRRRLLLFGGEDIRYHVPLRRVYLELLAGVWEGWAVAWAHEGIAEIAESAGVPRKAVLSEPERPQQPPRQPDDEEWTDTAASVLWEDGRLLLYPLDAWADDLLPLGPELLESLRVQPGRERLPLDEWFPEFPLGGGFHVDLRERTLEFWTADDAPDIERRTGARWPGWRVQWHRDRFEEHVARTQGALSLPLAPREQLLRRVVAMLVDHPRGRSPVDALFASAFENAEAAPDVAINPYALRYDPLQIDPSEKEHVLRRALERYRARHGL